MYKELGLRETIFDEISWILINYYLIKPWILKIFFKKIGCIE